MYLSVDLTDPNSKSWSTDTEIPLSGSFLEPFSGTGAARGDLQSDRKFAPELVTTRRIIDVRQHILQVTASPEESAGRRNRRRFLAWSSHSKSSIRPSICHCNDTRAHTVLYTGCRDRQVPSTYILGPLDHMQAAS